MNVPLFITYPLRSLWRGGSPIRLAILCIAIGVMVVVAIQSIDQIATNSSTNSVRIANGGDISLSVGDPNTPFTQNDLSFLAQLKHAQTIKQYTPVNIENGTIGNTPAPFSGLLIQVVDPQQFPLVTAPTFIAPATGSVKTLLTGNQVIVTQTFLTHYHKKIGDTFDIQVQSLVQSNAVRTLHVRLAGVIANTGAYPPGNTFVLVSFATYQTADPSQPVTYTSIDITTTDQTHTDLAIHALQNEVQKGLFPPVAIQTATDLQKTVQNFSDQTMHTRALAGLLALLIGGLGIMNTMQVLLSRRTIEIAMLKTAGYSRLRLALLFGIETGVLGFLGGLIGTAAAIAISYGVVTTLLALPFVIDPWILCSGMALGTVTSLIFGLIPIVQSANIRPIQVIREWSGSNASTYKTSTLTLFVLISLLFCALASAIVQNILLACASVCVTEIFLGGLYLCFRPIVSGISVIPIPERLSTKFLTVILSGMLFAGILCVFQSFWGGIILVCLFLLLMLQLLPPYWKMNVRIALRNIGRRPMRSTMLMLILFVGVFVIGSIQVVSADLQNQLVTTTNQELSYNVIAKVPQKQAPTMHSQLTHLSGLVSSYTTTIAATTIKQINAQPWKSFLTSADTNIQVSSGSPVSQMLHDSDGIEGYDLANQHLPVPTMHFVTGRNLKASDAGTNNVLFPYSPLLNSKFKLGIGSTLTIESPDTQTSRTLTIVGEYSSGGLSLTNVYPLLASQEVVTALNTPNTQSVFYLKIDPTQTTQAQDTLRKNIPGVSFVTTSATRVDAYLQGLSTISWIFTVVGSLVLLAGVIVMANAVILDMGERRRELGILKAIGYTQKTLQEEILLEYGLIGSLSAILADLLITLFSNFFGNSFLHATSGDLSNTGTTITFTFSTSGLLLTYLIIGAIFLVIITSLLSSWRTVRIRPLDVLRYE